MTISSDVRKAGPFAGNGVTTSFPFTFKVFARSDVKLLLINAVGVSTTLTLDSDYSVTLSSNQDATPGGTIAYPITGLPMPAGYSLVALGDLPYDQQTDITNSGGFYPQVIEDMSDRSTIQIQQLAELAGRAIVVTEAESTSPVLPPAAARANTLLGFDASGNLEMMPITASVGAGDLHNELGADGKAGFIAGTDFVAGTSTFLTLSRSYGTLDNLWVAFDAAEQGADSMTLVGNQLNFNAPIPLGTQRVYVKGGTTLSIYLPPSASVGDAQINWSGLLERVVANIAALQAASTTKYSHAATKGYYAPGDGGADAWFAMPMGTALQWSDVQANDGGVWRRVFKGKINSKQLGLLGDGNQNGTVGTDQTALFQSILNNLPAYTTLEFLPGYYNVTSVDFLSSITNCTFIFNDAWISGVATTAKDAIVRLYGCNNSKFYNLNVVSDGAAGTVVHQGNYGTAIQFKSDATAVPPINTCFNYFYGGNIRYIKAGVTYGALLGQAAQVASQQSENWFFGFQFRGVNQCVYGNAINSYSTWIGCLFLAQQMESNASWWADSTGFCVRNEINSIGNHLITIGCEYQRAIQNGSSIYGSNMTIRDSTWEVGCQAFLTGDVFISGDADGFFGPAGLAPFAIAGGSTGTLTLEDFRTNRPSGTAAFDRAKFVDATGSINYKVVMRKCHIQEWFFDGTDAAAPFVHGCQAKFEEVTIDNATTTSWYLDDGRANCINNVDRSGLSLPTGGTSGASAGWVTSNPSSGAYQQFVGDGPFGLAQSIRVVTTAAGFNLSTDTTNRFKVDGNRDYHFSVPFKFGTVNPAASIDPIIDWYDYGNNLISSSDCGGLGQTAAAANGFNSWQMYRSVVKAPVNAYTAVLRFVFGTSSTILFCLPSLN